MTDIEIVAIYLFIAIVAAISYKIGHKHGIKDAVDFLHKNKFISVDLEEDT